MKGWKSKYPTLAALVAEARDSDDDDGVAFQHPTDSEEVFDEYLDSVITSGIVELRAANEARDGSIENRARALSALTNKMCTRMRRDRAVFDLLK